MGILQASIIVILLSTLTLTHATTIDVVNNCGYTVWAAASPGGGQQLNPGETWQLNPAPGTSMARVWGRTGCTFDANGNGRCDTGDCGKLVCDNGNWGTVPKTLAEYTLANPSDTIDMSLVEGFNIPMDFSPTSGFGGTCKGITCNADINGECPQELKATGGCNNPCSVFKEVKYCCTSERGSCGPTDYSQFFKTRCPDAYSYPQDDNTSTFACASGTNYKVTFCP
ncbi:unnamed protein product [Amaranthus hypochondriacus]